MMHKPASIAFKLSKSAERMVKKGHPWVFDGAIGKQNKEGVAGDLAIIFDSQSNSFLALGLYDPNSPIRIKVLSVHQRITFNLDWLLNKFKTAYIKRAELLNGDTNSYRLIYGENDGIPGVIVDVYNDVAVLKLYSQIWIPYLNEVVEAIKSIPKISVIVFRAGRNILQEGLDFKEGDILSGNLETENVEFVEHGVKFSANVCLGHKTGYFLDHRHNRNRVGQLSKGKRVLDIFSYAGGFSVHALVGGAVEVTSVDISKPALALAVHNASLNVFKGMHKTISGDAFEVMKDLTHQGVVYDIVVVDPPSFAKKKEEIKGALNSYKRLIMFAEKLVAFGGILVMASCSSRISKEEFFQLVENGLLTANRNYEIMEKTGHDIDHPISFAEGAYLKCGYYKLQ